MPEEETAYIISKVEIVTDEKNDERVVQVRIPRELQKVPLSIPKKARWVKNGELQGFEYEDSAI
jgi:hypothetical protein